MTKIKSGIKIATAVAWEMSSLIISLTGCVLIWLFWSGYADRLGWDEEVLALGATVSWALFAITEWLKGVTGMVFSLLPRNDSRVVELVTKSNAETVAKVLAEVTAKAAEQAAEDRKLAEKARAEEREERARDREEAAKDREMIREILQQMKEDRERKQNDS